MADAVASAAASATSSMHSIEDKEKIQLAIQEGHDADIPSNLGVINEHSHQSERTSLSGSHDLEKGNSSNHKDSALTGEAEVPPEQDPNIVDWDGPNDLENPLNWSEKKKWSAVAVISASTFITPLGSSITAPGVPLLMKEFGSNDTLLASFVVSVYLLGFVFGPLFVAPMSEIYGRVPLYHSANVLFVIFSIACAVSQNLPEFIVFRFLQGLAGVTPVTIGGGSCADMIHLEKRGAALAMWSMGPLLGPIVGPAAGGYLSQAAGWRWVFWLTTIVSGVLTILCFILMRETYAPVLLERKTKRLRKETGNPNLRSKLDSGLPPKVLFKRAIIRPTKMLFLSPIVFILSLDLSIVYGYLYLLFTTFTYVFEGQYGFSTGGAGLTFLGIGIGMFSGLIICGRLSDVILKRKTAANNGVSKPEFRLPLLIWGSLAIPIGLFWYGWAAQAKTHWIVPIIGTCFIGLGLLFTFMPISVYFIDAFTRYAASAMAANTVIRSLFGALLPLAAQDMYAKLGLGWGNSLLAFIALAMIPFTYLIVRHGEHIRTHPRFQLDL